MPETQELIAAVFREAEQDSTMESMRIARFADDEVLVRLVATGVCHTDVSCRNGRLPLQRPIILGHEGAGIVEKVGADVTAVAPGDAVLMSFLACGECPRCKSGEPAYCHNFMAGNFSGRRPDGSTALEGVEDSVSAHFFGQSSFATYSVANQRNVVKIRPDAPLELLGPLGCGVQTGAGSVMNVLRPRAGESLGVFGGGGVGLSAVMAAVVEGCSPIVVVEPNAERRALALELGATAVIDPLTEPDLVARIRALTDSGLDHAVDTCGIPAVITQAIGSLAPHGQIVLLTANSMDATITLPIIGLVAGGVRIHGVNMGSSVPREFIPRLVDLIMEGRFPLERLVKFYPFAEINQALADQEHGKAIKPILRMAAA